MKKLLFIALLVCAKLVDAQVCFSSATSYSVPSIMSNAVYICSADFNGDGKVDLATTFGNGGHGIAVFLGTGTGAFGTGTNVGSSGGYDTQIVTADFNGDNKADLAFPNSPNQIAIILGTGTGTFGPNITFTVGAVGSSGTSGINTADLNGDLKADLIVTDFATNNVCILLGTGTGSFSAVTSFSVGNSPFSVITADFNNDGKLDLATANEMSNNVSVLLGNGIGGFGAASNFSAGTYPYSLTSADFNGDGKIDLAVADTIDISVFLNTGSGSFGSATHFTVGTIPEWVISADFNGDAKIDLAVAHNGYDVSILLGQGNGSFSSSSNFIVGTNPYSLTSADFNGDGKLDLATANYNSSNISALLNCTPTPTCVASVTDSMYNISPLNWGVSTKYSPQVTSAIWHWGDGTSTTGLYPNHTYTTAGRYSICATVYTSCGDSASTCRTDSLYRYASNSSMVNVNVVANTTGVNQVTGNHSQVTVFPNPSNNFITIQSSTELGAITIYNALGEIVLQTKSKNTQEQIDVSKLPTGIYTIKVQGGYSKLIKE